ncbi:hypothetical protein Tco_0799134 [Tanacetum coccineum]
MVGIDLDMNVFEDDIGGDISNNSFDLNDNAVSGNGNNDVLLLEGGDGFVDSVGGDKNHECKQDQQDKQPSLADVLYELRALRKEVALFKSSCLSPEMPNDEVVVDGTAIHNADEMYDSPNVVKVLEIMNLNISCPEMHNAEVLVAGMGIDKAYENIYSSNDNDNDVNQGITISFNAHMSNSSGHEIPNVVVVVACMGIDKPDGHNDNPNANDNDVNKGIDPMSTCSSPDMHLAEVAVVGMEIDKGDGHIDIATASDNDVNLAKSVSVNDLMPISVSPDCLMPSCHLFLGFQNEVDDCCFEEKLFLAKEVAGLFLVTRIRGIDFLQHDDHVDCSVAKPNDHPTADIGVKPVHENEFADDFMDVLNDEESLPKVSLDDMNAQSNKSDYVNVVTDDYKPCLASVFAQVKKRKKSDMKTNYVLRSAKERKKRLAMALESLFSQQPPTTPVPPKRISRFVDCDFILPPDFEEDVFGQPKMSTLIYGWISCGVLDNSTQIGPWYLVAWRDVEKVYFPVNEPKEELCLAEASYHTGSLTFYDALGWSTGFYRAKVIAVEDNGKISIKFPCY